MAKVEPFSVDELGSIKKMMDAGYSKESAERGIFTLRRAVRMAHCTDRSAPFKINGAPEKKKT
jgi:hypothetical protein